MDCWMGQVLTVGHVDNQQEVWHAEECEWVWRFADIECFADESNDPNLVYRIRKAETP